MMGPGSGYAPDPVRPAGARSTYNGAGTGADGGDDVLSQIKKVTSKVEDAIEAYSHVSTAQSEGSVASRGTVRRSFMRLANYPDKGERVFEQF
jgi:hypothetical protein